VVKGRPMVIYVDIDETICYYKDVRHYPDAIPIKANIDKINQLYDENNTIIYWTARGTQTGIDWLEITRNQFKEWGVKYDDLLFGKPNYDLFIDDKNIDFNTFFEKKSMKKYVPKGWGYEVWIHNDEKYCGKLLYFEKGKKCSWHYHKIKTETFYLQSGKMLVHFGDVDDRSLSSELLLTPGDTFEIPIGRRHQMTALEVLLTMLQKTQP